MRPHTVKISLALLFGAHFLMSAAHASDWNGSYSADGKCHCVGVLEADISNTIVPTPIGGQTVAQVCQRVGAGPGLSKLNGEFSHPVYRDAQCGHGPFSEEVTIGNTSDNPPGPKWNLKSAFAKKPKTEKAPIAKTVVKTESTTTNAKKTSKSVRGAAKVAAEVAAAKSKEPLEKPKVTSVTVQKPSDNTNGSENLKTSVVSASTTTSTKSAKKESLPPFTGKVITIEGKRYMQARDDIPTKGGAPGSRIILDGKVYLLDDGNIPPADLYRRQFGNVKKSSAKPVSQAPESVKTKTAIAARSPGGTNKVAVKPTQADIRSTGTSVADFNDRNHVPRKPVLPVVPSTAPVKPVTNISSVKKAELLPVIPAKPEVSVSKPELQTIDKDSVVELKPIPKQTEEQVAATNSEIQNSSSDSGIAQVGILSALRLPSSVRSREDNFSYVEAMPANFDLGGNGVVLKGSTESHSRFHYVGRIAVADTYHEVMLGGGLYLTPKAADRFTLVLQAGVEHGSFQLEDSQDSNVSVNYGSSGLYFGAATRMIVNRQMELRGGLGYSTFFKGDLKAFGGAYWHISPQLDVVSRFELGDNDLLGLGVRYYY